MSLIFGGREGRREGERMVIIRLSKLLTLKLNLLVGDMPALVSEMISQPLQC